MQVIRDHLVMLAAKLESVIDDKVYPVSKKKLSAGLGDLNLIIEQLNQALAIRATSTFIISDGGITVTVVAEEVKVENGCLLFYTDNKVIAIHPKIASLEITR
ncbi:MAG: hypothetical protein ACC707_01655 [Thiohalomonadales bacterium]